MTCSSAPVSFARNWSAMALATSLSTEKMSVSLRSKVSAHRWESLAALINCTFHTHSVAAPLDTSFQDVSNPKLLADLGQVFRRTFVMLRGSARDYFQIGDLG